MFTINLAEIIELALSGVSVSMHTSQCTEGTGGTQKTCPKREFPHTSDLQPATTHKIYAAPVWCNLTFRFLYSLFNK